MKRIFLLLLLVLGTTAAPDRMPSLAQGTSLVTMNISAGFSGRFRDNTWTPIQVSLQNASRSTFTGDLVIRPERSQGVTNPVRTPVSLAPDTQQVFTLYVSLRTFADTLRVELLTESGLIATEADAQVQVVLPSERLYVRVTDGSSRPVSLAAAASYAQSIVQTDWFPSNLPDRAVGLDSVDLILFSNADTGQLTSQQRAALTEWVTGGGHLIVAGGANWQATAAGLRELLPFDPDWSELTTDVDGLSALAGVRTDLSDVETAIARGTLNEDAVVLATDSGDQPLVVRRSQGDGLVDYLAFDPSSPPFRTWHGLDDLWFSLVTSRDARPGWTYGFLNLTHGYNTVEILPGITALPEALAMMAFLAIYIVLIGPVNYLILSRLGRRELAWITIPALILVFTIVAWVTGFNLRGSEVVLSRLSVVESWTDAEEAHINQLIGMLSPRRATYDLELPDARALRPMLRTAPGGFFTNQASPVEIVQTDIFSAVDFPVDASFMAGFVTSGVTPRPELSGSVTVIDNPALDMQTWRGSIRSDLPVALTDVVLLSRAGPVHLEDPIYPGEIRIIEETLEVLPHPPIPAAPQEYTETFLSPSQTRYVSRGRGGNLVGPEQTLRDVVGAEQFRAQVFFGLPYTGEPLTQAEQRRQTFLANFMIDQFNATARGDNVYLIGWTDQSPFEENVVGANWRSVDTTVYIVELETSMQAAPGELDRIAPDQFTWVLLEDEAASQSTPNLLASFGRSILSFRLTPVPTSVLETVEELYILIERGSASLTNTEVRLYNWQTSQYDAIIVSSERTAVRNPARYIGPNNAVQIEIDRSQSVGAQSISRIAVEQRGTRGA